MFTIKMADGVCFGIQQVTAKATTVEKALGFIGEFAEIHRLLLKTPWIQRNGRWTIDVFDWCDCWFTDPPVLAEIIAPPGFTPNA